MDVPQPTDEEIVARLAAHRWEQLFAVVVRLTEADLWVPWQQPPTDDHGAIHLGFPIYSEAIEAIQRLLYELQVIVVFDWMYWDGQGRYPGGQGLAEASVADAARLATATIRGERFSEGTIDRALADGSFLAVLERLRTWYAHER